MKVLIVLCAVLGIAAGGGSQLLYHNRIYPHVRAGGIDVGGQTQAGAMNQLRPFSIEQRFRAIALRVPRGATVYVPAHTLGYRVDGSLTAQRAYAIGREGSPLHRLVTQVRTLLGGADVAVVQDVDGARLHTYLVGLAASLNRAPRPGHPGRRLDVALAQQRIARLLPHVGAFHVDLPFTAVPYVALPARPHHGHIVLKHHVGAH